ncbi:hypothetical protein B0H17DRAFT_1074385 [Mycena rosella]|uniref:Uncharacterized protein n=1 Tax=Mycena rosella TaxID=1033263 RepID=A0AAD7D7U4_MYCRO|nr:hypothetical protein B0H17DRAFT_1074385 [Mycena rosella]
MPKQPKSRTASYHGQVPGMHVRLFRASKRSLESWAVTYGFRDEALGLPLNERAVFYRDRLYELQRKGQGPCYGQPMTPVPMSESDWPNRKYRAEAKGETYVTKSERSRQKLEKKKMKRASTSTGEGSGSRGGEEA